MIEYAVRAPLAGVPGTDHVILPLPRGITEDMAREWVPLAGPGAELLSRTLPEWTVTP